MDIDKRISIKSRYFAAIVQGLMSNPMVRPAYVGSLREGAFQADVELIQYASNLADLMVEDDEATRQYLQEEADNGHTN